MHNVNGQFILLDEFFRIGLWKRYSIQPYYWITWWILSLPTDKKGTQKPTEGFTFVGIFESSREKRWKENIINLIYFIFKKQIDSYTKWPIAWNRNNSVTYFDRVVLKSYFCNILDCRQASLSFKRALKFD